MASVDNASCAIDGYNKPHCNEIIHVYKKIIWLETDRRHKFNLHKISLLHELYWDDSDRAIYQREYWERIVGNPNYLL